MGSNVTIKLVNNKNLADFYMGGDQVATAKSLLASGLYNKAGDFFFSEEGEAAAEEAFDMTNNPSREYERAKYYGRFRSVSTGDIVEVEGVNYLCCSFGWKVVTA
jgi:hypothetical protein